MVGICQRHFPEDGVFVGLDGIAVAVVALAILATEGHDAAEGIEVIVRRAHHKLLFNSPAGHVTFKIDRRWAVYRWPDTVATAPAKPSVWKARRLNSAMPRRCSQSRKPFTLSVTGSSLGDTAG